MGPAITDPEVKMLACIAAGLSSDYADDDTAWEGSPFAWIKTRPSRQVGKIGEQLVAGWCAAKELDVTRAPDSDCDRVIEGLRAEVKFSTLWRGGFYMFQQLRDQRYDVAICLGLSPFDAHCWVLPKPVLMEHVIGHTPQHGGAAGRDTAWIKVDPGAVPEWLGEYGGRLSQAYALIGRLASER